MNAEAQKAGIKWLAITLTCVAFACAAFVQGQTYTPVYSYGTKAGDPKNPQPNGLMAQGRDGTLYSTAPAGGATNGGAAFHITTSGSLTKLTDFTSNEGAVGGLTLGFDGNFYGTTTGGGTSNAGTILKLTPAGQRTTLWNFTTLDDGANPVVAPLLGQDGMFYGVDPGDRVGFYGLAYKISSAGKFTGLGKFAYTNGASPNLPVLGMDGNFYGTARSGGTGTAGCQSGCGVVYKMTPSGKLTVLHNFAGYPADGSQPIGVLAQANDGALYGTTYTGGANNQGIVFKITTAGSYTLLYSFHDVAGSDGINPWNGVAVGTDGNLYGTAQGGKHNAGVLYKITPAGGESILYNFCNVSGCADGFFPQTPIAQLTNGKFYGNVESGGANGLNGGVFYSLDVGLQPFVKLITWKAAKGKTVEILGQGFTGTTNVSFNGASATFTLVSDTYLTAIVPAAATTGFVTVTTPSGALGSDRRFFAVPTITAIAPTSGSIGTVITITGNNFTGATKVTVGPRAALFTVNSATQISATVPTGAVTGKVKVTTAGGVATSAATFIVTP